MLEMFRGKKLLDPLILKSISCSHKRLERLKLAENHLPCPMGGWMAFLDLADFFGRQSGFGSR